MLFSRHLNRDYHASNSCSGRWVGCTAAAHDAAAGGRLRRGCDAGRWRSPARRAAAGTTATSGPALSKGRRGVRSNCVGESSLAARRPAQQAVFFYHGPHQQAPGCRVVRRNRGGVLRPGKGPTAPCAGSATFRAASCPAGRERGPCERPTSAWWSDAGCPCESFPELGSAHCGAGGWARRGRRCRGARRKQMLSTAQGKFAWLLLAHELPFKEGPNIFNSILSEQQICEDCPHV